MKRPLAGLVVVYASGIWVGSLLLWPQRGLFVLVLALFVAFLLLCRTRLAWGVLMALVFASGMLAYRHATTNSSTDSVERILGLRDQNAGLRGTIISDPGYRSNDVTDATPMPPDRHNFRLRLAAVMHDGQWQTSEGIIYMFVSEARSQEPLRYGDVIECSAVLHVPPPARNPGTFDWRGRLARQGIPFTATLGKSDSCSIIARDRGNCITALSLRLRERLENALRLGFEGESKLAGVLAAMVIGERAGIPPDTYEDFQRTGVFHVFAINGLHVGLVTVIVILVLRTARFPRRWRGVVAIPLLVLYVFATGAHPGAVRALVMACVWLVGWMLVRPTDLLNDLAAAALILLVWEPTQLFDSGFILSFTVVAAIVVLTPRIEEKLKPLTAPDPFLPRQYVSKWREWADVLLTWVVRLFSCSVAAWVGLMPLLALYFHLFTPVSVVTNLLVIPLLSVIITLGLAATMAHAVWPWLTLTLNNATFFFLHMMLHGVESLEKVPYGHQFVPAPPWWAIVGYYAIAILLINRQLPWQKRRWIAVAAAAAGVASLLFMAWPREAVDVTVLDLNDGMSVFVNGSGPQDAWLIDGGADWSGRRVIIPFLRAQGVNRLNALVLTRGDKAHADGLMEVAEEIPAAQVIESGVSSRSKFYTQWRDVLHDLRITPHTVRAGDEMMIAGRIKVRVLNPPRIATSGRGDENALVLLLEFGSTRLLLMSDAGETVENRLLQGGEDLRAQIIVKGRPSKGPSCTERFLDAVHPELVVQSVNMFPSDRYLQPDLRERLQQRGIPLKRTDETGAVIIHITREGYTVRTWLP